jgi:hypothetical protein
LINLAGFSFSKTSIVNFSFSKLFHLYKSSVFVNFILSLFHSDKVKLYFQFKYFFISSKTILSLETFKKSLFSSNFSLYEELALPSAEYHSTLCCEKAFNASKVSLLKTHDLSGFSWFSFRVDSIS